MRSSLKEDGKEAKGEEICRIRLRLSGLDDEELSANFTLQSQAKKQTRVISVTLQITWRCIGSANPAHLRDDGLTCLEPGTSNQGHEEKKR